MKYENFREIQNSMRVVTINSEFSLPGLMMANSVFMGNIQLYTAVPQPTCTLADLYDELCQN